MSTLSKHPIDGLPSIKMIVQSAYVDWSINTGSADWGRFVDENVENLRSPVQLALSVTKLASPHTMGQASYAEGLMELLMKLDFISGCDKVHRDRLKLIADTREHEVALAKETTKLTGKMLTAETRTRLAMNVDTSVTILTDQLEEIKRQSAEDTKRLRELYDRMVELESDFTYIQQQEEYDMMSPEDRVNFVPELVREYRMINTRFDKITRRKQAAITQALEVTTQLQMSVLTLDQLHSLLVGMVDSTYNYANPEAANELFEPTEKPYIEATILDG